MRACDDNDGVGAARERQFRRCGVVRSRRLRRDVTLCHDDCDQCGTVRQQQVRRDAVRRGTESASRPASGTCIRRDLCSTRPGSGFEPASGPFGARRGRHVHRMRESEPVLKSAQGSLYNMSVGQRWCADATMSVGQRWCADATMSAGQQ